MNSEILEAIAELTATVNENFQSLRDSISDIDDRLARQERASRKISKRQQLQEQDIEKLKKIVYELADRAPIKRRGDGVAISKETAYSRFAELGIGKVTGARALRDAGVLSVDSCGKNTIVISVDGKVRRVLLITSPEDSQ